MDSNTRGATWRPASCVNVRVRVCVFMYAFVPSGLEVASAAITSVLFAELIFFRVVSEVSWGCPGKSPHSRQSRRACASACMPRGLEVVSAAVASVAFSSVTRVFTARSPLSRYSSLHLSASLPPLSSLSVSMCACVRVHMCSVRWSSPAVVFTGHRNTGPQSKNSRWRRPCRQHIWE